MKWKRLFVLFFLIPTLIHASHFYDKQYARIFEKIIKEWQRHEELLVQFSKLSLDEKENHFDLLNKSIACCHRAIDHCDYILRKIAEKAKDERHDDYWVKAKNDRKQDKKNLIEVIKKIQALIEHTKKEIAISKANSHFQQSQENANLAYFKSQNFLPIRFNNVEKVVMAFNEIAGLYEAALHHASAALNFVASFADEENKKFLHQSIETYQQAAARFKQDAMQWPAIAETELAANKAKLAALKEEKRLLAEKGFEKNAYEVQKQIIAILEFLIVNLPGESSSYEEELSQIRMSLEEFENQAELSKGGTGISEIQTWALFYKDEFLLNPEKFISLAIAPAVIIPNKLCFASYNYISRRDFVTHLDVIGKMKYGNELQILEPHPNAKLWDHESVLYKSFFEPASESEIRRAQSENRSREP